MKEKWGSYMASIQEYCKKLSIQQLLSVLDEHEGNDDPYSLWLTQLIHSILSEREKRGEM